MLFRSYRKRKALESYRYVLGPRLRGLHGRKETYSAAEVLATARDYRLSETFLCYALAMYCDAEAFAAYHREQGEVACSYDRLWRELSQTVSYQRVAVMPVDLDADESLGDVAEALSDIAHSHSDAACDAIDHAFDFVSHSVDTGHH